MFTSRLILQLQATWLTAWRAGARRSGYRIGRQVRLRFLNPLLARRWYPKPDLSAKLVGESDEKVRDLLDYIVQQRAQSHGLPAWDWRTDQLTLLNQDPVSLSPRVNWETSPSADPLWAYTLHGWEWIWDALLDPRTHERIRTLMLDWINHFPVGRGIAWDPYPTSRRIIVWSAAWIAMDRPLDLASAIAQQAHFLTDNLERDLDNNHLIANAKALSWAGILLAPLPPANAWRATGLNCLWDQLSKQVNADGGHCENSTTYHLSVWLDGMETALLAQVCGYSPPAYVWSLLEKMGEFALALRRPDGRLPLLNDAIQDEPVPLQNIFSLAADLFDRADFAWAAGREEVNSPVLASQGFEDTGYAVLRTNCQPLRQIYLLLDAGNMGRRHCPGHGHADALSIELWSRGRPILLDPGTYQYPSGRWRDYFRSTAAHSTVTIDDENQSLFAGPFRVAHVASARLLSVHTKDGRLEAEGEHDGYMRLKDPVHHKRRVRVHGENLVTIEDRLEGNAEHQIGLHFHLAPCQIEIRSASCAVVQLSGGLEVEITVSSAINGGFEAEEGWISRGWYEREASPVLVYRGCTRLPTTVTTHLSISHLSPS